MNLSKWPERGQRHNVQLEAAVVQADGSTVTTIVNDLSLKGCRVTGGYGIGDRLTLDLPGIGKVEGKVRWSVNGRAGIRFDSADEA